MQNSKKECKSHRVIAKTEVQHEDVSHAMLALYRLMTAGVDAKNMTGQRRHSRFCLDKNASQSRLKVVRTMVVYMRPTAVRPFAS